MLKDAGVVDAGGHGFTLLLDAFLHVVDGRPIPEPEVVDDAGRGRARTCAGDDVSSLRYEVMYLLDADDDDDPGVQGRRGARSATRSSSSAATGCGTATCTPTTSAPRSRPASRPGARRKIRVTDLLEQVEEEQWVRDARRSTAARRAASSRSTTARRRGRRSATGVRRLLTQPRRAARSSRAASR